MSGEEEDKKEPSGVQKIITYFAEESTAISLNKMARAQYLPIKVFWCVVLATGIGVNFYFCEQLLDTFLEDGTTTDIQLEFSVLEFPAVTFCNQNRFRMDRLPSEFKDLMSSFLTAKRADMFGGQGGFVNFMNKQPGPLGPAGSSGNSDPVGPSGVSTQSSQISNSSEPVSGGVKAPAPSSASSGSNDSIINNSTTVKTESFLENSTVANSTTSNITNSQSSAPSASSASPAAPPRRKKRASVQLTEDQIEIMDKLSGFYSSIDEDMKNMTWFDNVGQSSADKLIFLNLSYYIAEHYSKEQLLSMGHDITEMLQECTFLGRVCGPKDFYQFYDIKYGNCYTFNSGMDRNISKIINPGATFGLSMVLFINQDKYIPVLTPEAGVRVLLHRQGEVPIMEEDGFDVSPGSKSNVAVKYVEISRLPENCEVESANDDPLYPGNYTQKGCLKSCVQLEIVKSCSCALPNYRKPNGTKVCVSTEEYQCATELENRVLESDGCSLRCPLPCWESHYQHVISTSQWPSNSYMPYLKESFEERGGNIRSLFQSSTREGLTQQFLKVNIYYDNLNYYLHTERKIMTIPDFLGAIGGHFGLWIGITLVSVFEVVELFYNLAAYGIRNKLKKLMNLRERTVTPVECFKPEMAKSPKLQ